MHFFFNENVWMSLKISLNFIPKILINNIAVLVQIMAWRWPGEKPLSEPMMARLLMHICVTRPQWVSMVKMSSRKFWRQWYLTPFGYRNASQILMLSDKSEHTCDFETLRRTWYYIWIDQYYICPSYIINNGAVTCKCHLAGNLWGASTGHHYVNHT